MKDSINLKRQLNLKQGDKMPNDPDALQDKMRERIIPKASSTSDLITGNKASVEGNVEFVRGQGRRIFGRQLNLPELKRIYVGVRTENINDFLDDWFCLMPVENKRVRITLEIIED
jgi:hypothetical protein